jgi:hypothetical protein
MPKGNPEERAANASVTQAEKDFAQARFDVGAEREKAEGKFEGGPPRLESATGAKATLQRLARPVQRQRKWSTAVVATVTLAVGVVTAVGVTAILSQLKHDEIDAQSRQAALHKEQAAALRRSATEACRDHHWGQCRSVLDDARELDPPGEGTLEVKALRKAIDEGTAPPK